MESKSRNLLDLKKSHDLELAWINAEFDELKSHSNKAWIFESKIS